MKDLRGIVVECVKQSFGKSIKQNFMLQIMDMVTNKYKFQLGQFFPKSSECDVIAGKIDPLPQYEICRLIVGIHSMNTMFLNDEERVKLENSDNYRNRLCEEVFTRIKIRGPSGAISRNKQITEGEDLIYYPAAHDLLALTNVVYKHLLDGVDKQLYPLYAPLVTKALAALFLLEDNILDGTYPLCRGMIEVYLKMSAITSNNDSFKQTYEMFCALTNSEIKITQTDQKEDDELDRLFANRVNKSERSKSNFLHYGFVDNIKNYHKIVKNKPYSIGGITDYLASFYGDDGRFFKDLGDYYTQCHAYTHGNLSVCMYPIIQYYEACVMIYLVISSLAKSFVTNYNMSPLLNGVDLIKLVDEDMKLLVAKRQMVTTESLKRHYSYKNRKFYGGN